MQNRKAFSVVEVLVALVVFSVASLGCAASLGLAARAHREAGARREAVRALELKLAIASIMPCDSLVNSASMVDSVPVIMRVVRSDSVLAITVDAVHRNTATSLRAEITCR